MTSDNQPAQRPLTAREREILDFLLAVEVPGVEELRSQAEFAAAAGPRSARPSGTRTGSLSVARRLRAASGHSPADGSGTRDPRLPALGRHAGRRGASEPG